MLKACCYFFQTPQKLFIPLKYQKRNFWEYVNMMFNKIDLERLKKFGPNRTCAEWVLRNGGKIVWDNGITLSDYNLLPGEDKPVPKIMEIDATNSGISHYGFPHLSNILDHTSSIDDRALAGLSYAKESLKYVQISNCVQVTDSGLKELKVLAKLETLILFNLPSVDDLNGCKQFLLNHLCNCKIEDPADEVI